MPAAPAMQGGQMRDFSAGPNIRDAPTELAPNEVVDAWNVTFDERGGVSSRLGFEKYNPGVYDATQKVRSLWWSTLLNTPIVQVGAKLYKGVSNVVTKTFTTDDIVTFREINSLLVASHPVDGLFTSPDGTTWTAVADPDAPKGGCLEVWQNKLWVGQKGGKVTWSDPGDPTAWTSTSFNKLWEHDQQDIVALHVGSGQDILGKPGLLAFKQESTYRINDSTTGAYTTIDATVGSAGPLAVVGVGARVITISKRGVFWWREDQAGMVNASDRFLPLWDPSQVNLAEQTRWCAGRKNNRAVFSLTRGTSTDNDLALEFHPDQDWLAPRSDAMSCYATSGGAAEDLYGGSPTVEGQVYLVGNAATDDGAAIEGRLQTRWVELNSGFQSTLWQVRVHGRGTGNLTVRVDYVSSGGSVLPFDLTGDLPLYDSGLLYDTGVDYGEPAFQQTQPFFGLGICRQFSLLFEFSADSTADGPQVLGAGNPPQVGEFGLYGIEWLHVPLGLS